MATCFPDFLRFSEVLNIRLEDLTLAGSDLRFRVRKAKNHRLGFDVCLPVGDPKSIGSFVLDFLSCPLATLHCTAAAKTLIEAVSLDPSKYSTHSAKRGSATASVVAGCTDAEVTALGRWKSAETGKQYVHGSEEFRKRLSTRFCL
jgi:hypothetical protein